MIRCGTMTVYWRASDDPDDRYRNRKRWKLGQPNCIDDSVDARLPSPSSNRVDRFCSCFSSMSTWCCFQCIPLRLDGSVWTSFITTCLRVALKAMASSLRPRWRSMTRTAVSRVPSQVSAFTQESVMTCCVTMSGSDDYLLEGEVRRGELAPRSGSRSLSQRVVHAPRQNNAKITRAMGTSLGERWLESVAQ